jgi:hypothetical protein
VGEAEPLTAAAPCPVLVVYFTSSAASTAASLIEFAPGGQGISG